MQILTTELAKTIYNILNKYYNNTEASDDSAHIALTNFILFYLFLEWMLI